MRVVVLTTFDIDEYAFGALRAGARGFLLKDIDAEDLGRAIRSVVSGHSLLAPAVTRHVIETFTRGAGAAPVRPDRLDVLTDRERQAVRLAALGLTNDEIAGHQTPSRNLRAASPASASLPGTTRRRSSTRASSIFVDQDCDVRSMMATLRSG